MSLNIGALQIVLPSDREIAFSRAFDAPRHLVFDTFTNPDRVRHWLSGPAGWRLTTCDIELSIGGFYHYVWKRDADGAESSIRGIFRDVVPERLVASEMTDAALCSGRVLDTTVLVDRGSTTIFKMAALYETIEARDTVLSGTTLSDLASGYDRLASYLASVGRSLSQTTAAGLSDLRAEAYQL